MSRNQITFLVLCMTAACSAPVDEHALSQSESAAKEVNGEVGADSVGIEAKAACDNASAPQTVPDPGYRLEVYETNENKGPHAMPSPNTNWSLKYEYTVPPLPCSSTWNHTDQTFYIWGDLDFDYYAANGVRPISSYLYNQIVPQLMIGNGLASNDSAYTPSWVQFKSWVIQAQYFWMNQNGSYYALAGKAVNVSPGDLVTTVIKYTASTGVIDATISTSKASSSISIPRPFLNESPALFKSWKDFFQKGVAQSSTLYARPLMNVESHYVDATTMCSVLPWTVDLFSEPGTTAKGSSYSFDTTGGFTCPKGRYATLNF